MSALRHRPSLLDLAVAATVVAVLLIDSETGEHGAGISVAGVLASLGVGLPLLWRRYAPIAVVFVMAPFVYLANHTLECYDAAIVGPAVAVFSVALYSDRRRALAIGGAIVPLVVFGVGITGEQVFSGTTVENLAWVLLALVAGDALRSRSAAASELAERRRVEQREAAAEADRRVTDERLRIAREVHDVVAHSMVAINVQAGTASHLIDADPEQARTALREIKRVSGSALTDLRATLGLLRDPGAEPPTRPTERLQELTDLAVPLRAAGIAVEVTVDGPAEDVPSAIGTAAYRIVQEALTNVARHANARHAAVHVGVGSSAVEVEVLDDGAGGVNGGSPGSGNGLRGMRERAGAIGGEVETGRRDNGGWRVHASLPLKTT